MSISIFACGGGGINVVAGIPALGNDKAYSGATRYYLDTSTKNLGCNKLSPTDSNVFLLPQADGSGGMMSENKVAINDAIGGVLSRFKTGDLNIIVSSASGGSGPAFALYLAKELLERDEAVIVMLIGSFESSRRIENTIASVKSLTGICKVTGKPLLFTYRQNTKPDDKEINESLQEDIRALCLLYSNNLGTLDTKDLYHWVRFEKVCSQEHFMPQPYLLRIYEGTNPAMFQDVKQPISVASVYSPEVEPEHLAFEILPSYTTHGIMQESTLSVKSLHYVVTRDVLDEIVDGLIVTQEEAAKQIKARQRKPVLNIDGADANGMSF
jgi:hypothetical protein